MFELYWGHMNAEIVTCVSSCLDMDAYVKITCCWIILINVISISMLFLIVFCSIFVLCWIVLLSLQWSRHTLTLCYVTALVSVRQTARSAQARVCVWFRCTLHYGDKKSPQRWQYPKSLSLWEHFLVSMRTQAYKSCRVRVLKCLWFSVTGRFRCRVRVQT